MLDIFGQVALAVADVEVAGPEVDLDFVDGREFQQMRLGFLGEVEQRLGALEAEFLLQLLRARPLAGAELAAVAARCAVADAMRLDQRDARAGLGQMRCGRQAGEAAADDDDIGGEVAVERRVFRTRPGRVLIPGIAGRDGGLVRS